MLDGKSVTGVRYSVGGLSRSAMARAEVVLCAGAIGTPHLLQRSGIGPAATLQGAGIPVQHDLPGVGGNLQDHLQQRAIFRVAGIRTLNETYHSLPRRAAMGLDFALRRRGPLTMAPSQLGIFTRSGPDQERPNLQFHVQPLSLDRFGEPLHRFPAITVSACNLRPTSRGSVRAISPNAGDAPKIAPNYLSTDQDRKIAADAIRVTRRLMNQAAIKPYVASELVPGPQVSDSDADLARAAGDIGTTIFHPVGTARMGRADNPDAVVDERLRVIGLSGLRIADASIMPTIVSGNTNTPTIMIAAMAAKFILQDER
jgi:choline dehydrogenase-like flavoprotein